MLAFACARDGARVPNLRPRLRFQRCTSDIAVDIEHIELHASSKADVSRGPARPPIDDGWEFRAGVEQTVLCQWSLLTGDEG